MEKAVRSVIQRHLRGWAPYPHIEVVPTASGHSVHWRAAEDMLNMKLLVTINTVGLPARRDFSIKTVLGERKWTRQDMHMMDCDEHLNARQPWATAVAPGRIEALSTQECISILNHLRKSWQSNARAKSFLDLVHIQNFTPATELHTALDVLAEASTSESMYSEKTQIAPLARILIGHAMDNERKAWSCKFSHPRVKWNDMAIVAWKGYSSWNVCIVPVDDPILFSDYHWQQTHAGLVFYDKLSWTAPVDTLITRGSYERYTRSHYIEPDLEAVHWDSVYALLSSPIASIEPDTAWVQPIVAAFQKGLGTSACITNEQYAFMCAFEEKAFDCLIACATTLEGRGIAGCIAVSRSLDEPAKNVQDWQKRLLVWNNIIAGMQQEELKIDSNVFEGVGP